jgi:hypothetical protein
VDGGRHGVDTLSSVFAQKVNVCGNSLRLDVPFDRYDDQYGAISSLTDCEHLNMSGNSISDGYLAVRYVSACINGFILKNDYRNLRHGGIFVDTGNTLGWQTVAKNVLSSGVSYHMRSPLVNDQRFFTGKNAFLVNSTTNAPVLDSSGLAIHLVQ